MRKLRNTVDTEETEGGFNLQYRRSITLKGSDTQLKKYLDEFRDDMNLQKKHFKSLKKWRIEYAEAMNLDESRLLCLRPKSAKVPKAHLILIDCGMYIRISTIIYSDGRTLNCEDYNKVVDAFIKEYLSKDICKDLRVEIDKVYEPLETVMGSEAAEALRAWEYSCTIEPDFKVISDDTLWLKAILAAANDETPINGNFLKEWLKTAIRWREESYPSVEHYAQLWDYSLALLEASRKASEETPHEEQEVAETTEHDLSLHEPLDIPSDLQYNASHISKEMNSRLFAPQNEGEYARINTYYQKWVDLATEAKNKGSIQDALDICIVVLSQIGYRFEKDKYYTYCRESHAMEETCMNAGHLVTEIMRLPEITLNAKYKILRRLKDIAQFKSFTDYGFFKIDDLIQNAEFVIMMSGKGPVLVKLENFK